MSYPACNAYVSLPSRYGLSDGYNQPVEFGRRSPRWLSKDLGSNRHGLESTRAFGLSELERHIQTAGNLESDHWIGQGRDYSRSPRLTDRARSVSPLRGIHSLECYSKLPISTVYARNLSSPPTSRRNSSPPTSRRNSVSRLSAWSPEETGLELSLSRKVWSGSEMDLRASLTENVHKRADLVQSLREAQGNLEGQSEELKKRDKELELSRAKIELLALKQKQLEASISQLEKEKGWLEVSRFEDKKQRGELQDRIINLEMEVLLAKSSLENCNYTNELINQKISVSSKGNDEVYKELKTARENLVYFRNRAKVLEAEKKQAVEELTKLREGSQMALSQMNEANQRVTDTFQNRQSLHDELADLQLNFNNINLEKELLSSKNVRLEEKVSDLHFRLKVAQTDRERFLQEKLELHRRTQELSLELERSQRGREGFNDQVSDLHIELVGAKAQANRQDQEKVQMKEELVTLKQVNDKLTAELGQIQQNLQSALEELHQTQAEHKISSNLAAALEAERKQLLEEKQMLETAMENDEESESVLDLRSSQTQLKEDRDKLQAERDKLEEERDKLHARCSDLEGTLEQAHEQLGSQIQEQQQVTLYWKERWQQIAVNLKNTEEVLEKERAQSQQAANKNTGLLSDCENLQADNVEVSELRVTVSRLKKENNQLTQQIKDLEQKRHLLEHFPGSLVEAKELIQNEMSQVSLGKFSKALSILESPDKENTRLTDIYRELQQAREQIQEQERERSDKELEMRKLKTDNGPLLRIELDACRQQLELERSRREMLQYRVSELESKLTESKRSQDSFGEVEIQNSMIQSQGSRLDDARSEIHSLEQQLEREREAKRQNDTMIFTLKEELEDLGSKKSGDMKVSLEEVDSELMLVREELQKVWDMLKTKDTELEEQYQELESARDQYTECSTEKVRLEQLVTSLQKQVEEKEQTMRHLQKIREMEKTEMDIKNSSLELKLAEMQEKSDKGSIHNVRQAGMKCWSPKGAQPTHNSHTCSRCEVFLQQLDKSIKGCQERNVELQEEKNQALTSLYQLQDILKGISKQTKVNEQVVQALQVDNETLKQQHKMVTEQLKGLFKEKQVLANAYKNIPQEEKPTDDWTVKSRLVKNVLSTIKTNNENQEELSKEQLKDDLQTPSGPSAEKDISKLQRQLEERSETISTMASEIKTLREKNESLMKAKLRFQNQVQQIRSISKPDREKEPTDPIVPRLSGNPRNLLPGNESETGSQGTLTPVTGTQTPEGSWTDSLQSSRSSTPINTSTTPTTSPLRLNIPRTMGKSWRNSTEGYLLSPRSHGEIEGTSDTRGPLTPRATALISPRPYQSPNTKQLGKS